MSLSRKLRQIISNGFPLPQHDIKSLPRYHFRFSCVINSDIKHANIKVPHEASISTVNLQSLRVATSDGIDHSSGHYSPPPSTGGGRVQLDPERHSVVLALMTIGNTGGGPSQVDYYILVWPSTVVNIDPVLNLIYIFRNTRKDLKDTFTVLSING